MEAGFDSPYSDAGTSLEPDVASRRFQAKEDPHTSPVLGPRCPRAPLVSQAAFVCVCFVSELIHLAPLLPPFLLFTPTISICLPALSKPIRLWTDLVHF